MGAEQAQSVCGEETSYSWFRKREDDQEFQRQSPVRSWPLPFDSTTRHAACEGHHSTGRPGEGRGASLTHRERTRREFMHFSASSLAPCFPHRPHHACTGVRASGSGERRAARRRAHLVCVVGFSVEFEEGARVRETSAQRACYLPSHTHTWAGRYARALVVDQEEREGGGKNVLCNRVRQDQRQLALARALLPLPRPCMCACSRLACGSAGKGRAQVDTSSVHVLHTPHLHLDSALVASDLSPKIKNAEGGRVFVFGREK